jgi:hypothetical protein
MTNEMTKRNALTKVTKHPFEYHPCRYHFSRGVGLVADSNLLDCCSQAKLRESLTESECRIRKLPSQIPLGFLAFLANETFERNSWTSGEKNDFLGGLLSGLVKKTKLVVT